MEIESSDSLAQLLQAVHTSRKYRDICPDLIRNIGAQELLKRRNLRQAIKATKDRLHQVGAAYLDRRVNYETWLAELRRARTMDEGELRRACCRIMAHHSSSRERLPILDRFYSVTLGDLPPIHTVLDIACGLNPLAIPWMPLAPDVEYYAYDIYQGMVGFLQEFLNLLPVRGAVQVCDVSQHCPARQADLAFLLKSIPCLEQIDRTAGMRLLEEIKANHLLISFPVQSLSGGEKGMEANYEAHFQTLIGNRRWRIKRFRFETELAFLVSR